MREVVNAQELGAAVMGCDEETLAVIHMCNGGNDLLIFVGCTVDRGCQFGLSVRPFGWKVIEARM